MPPLDARSCLGTHNVLFITIDSLRYDVAADAMRSGATPNLQAIAPGGLWQRRHSPSSFTYGAHTAFFAGFLPTPAAAGAAGAARLFATKFPGSRSVNARTLVFEQADIVSGFAANAYRTLCIGGVGFFNKASPLGSVLPNLFQESWWSEEMGVNNLQSTRHQVDKACACLARIPSAERVFLFMNISACHFPNRGYCEGAMCDGTETQAAALSYADTQLGRLFDTIRSDAPVLAVICSDHGEAYGEDGYQGHRLGHSSVWEVPYLETILPAGAA